MNTEKQEKLDLTATCANTKSAESEIETWNLHCDSNGNGIIDNDEEAKTVSVNTKANEFYCKGKANVIPDTILIKNSEKDDLRRIEMLKTSWSNLLM